MALVARKASIALSVTLLSVLFAVAWLTAYLARIALPPLTALDEKYYIKAGLAYLNGTPPIEVNLEHPPLAKYIIGLAVSTGVTYFASALAVSLSVVLLLYSVLELLRLANKVLEKPLLLLIIFAAIYFDPLFYSLAQHQLLDTYALLFVSGSIAVYTRIYVRGISGHKGIVLLVLLGVLIGASIASKYSTIYVIIGLVSFSFYRFMTGARRMAGSVGFALVVLAVALTVYVASFAVDIASGGLQVFFQHHVEMISYMSHRHGYSFPIALNGIATYFARVEVWKYPYDIHVYVWTQGTRVVNWTVEYVREDKLRIVLDYYAMGYALIIAPFISLYYLLTGRPWEKMIAIINISSMAMLLHGNIWWYYSLPALTGYLVLSYWALTGERRTLRVAFIVLGVAVAWTTYFLTLHGLLKRVIIVG